MKKHEWKLAWPGNYCLKCGIDDPIEAAVSGVTENGMVQCPECSEENRECCVRCEGQGIIINPDLVIPECI